MIYKWNNMHEEVYFMHISLFSHAGSYISHLAKLTTVTTCKSELANHKIQWLT